MTFEFIMMSFLWLSKNKYLDKIILMKNLKDYGWLIIQKYSSKFFA